MLYEQMLVRPWTLIMKWTHGTMDILISGSMHMYSYCNTYFYSCNTFIVVDKF